MKFKTKQQQHWTTTRMNISGLIFCLIGMLVNLQCFLSHSLIKSNKFDQIKKKRKETRTGGYRGVTVSEMGKKSRAVLTVIPITFIYLQLSKKWETRDSSDKNICKNRSSRVLVQIIPQIFYSFWQLRKRCFIFDFH